MGSLIVLRFTMFGHEQLQQLLWESVDILWICVSRLEYKKSHKKWENIWNGAEE